MYKIDINILNNAQHGDIIARGQLPDTLLVGDQGTGKALAWIAVRGYINDWAIYCEQPFDENFRWDGEVDYKRIADYGAKVPKNLINELVECDTEAMDKYRN